MKGANVLTKFGLPALDAQRMCQSLRHFRHKDAKESMMTTWIVTQNPTFILILSWQEMHSTHLVHFARASDVIRVFSFSAQKSNTGTNFERKIVNSKVLAPNSNKS
jgi:hypothetical protein